MLISMTGYGKVGKQIKDKYFIAEIRSLNSKNLDLKVKLPPEYKDLEPQIRKIFSEKVYRGKVDITLQVEYLSSQARNKINKVVVNEYINQLSDVYPDLDKSVILNSVLRFPDIFKQEEEIIDKDEINEILELINVTIDDFYEFRMKEGYGMDKDVEKNIKNIFELLKKISELDKNRINKKKEKLREELEQLKINIDENRFEQELIYYLEKYDINEELIRLENHLNYFTNELASDNILKGKKLGFVSQEIGREINTIGSKANDSEIQQLVIEMKDYLEKIKEQILNVL